MSDPNVAVDERSEFEAWRAEQQAKREAAARAEAERLAAEDAAKNAPADVPMIQHNETYMDGNVQKTRVHGPMPVSEWAEYERVHGL